MASAGATFAAEVRAWAHKAKARPEKVIRQFVVNLGTLLLENTVVGDPARWKRKPPPGYVPGSLMSNWNFSIGLIDESNGKPPNRSVSDGVDRLHSALLPPITDQAIYLVNAQPYARRIEYDSWSSAAPAGFVRITAVQADQVMLQTIQQVPE
jgi:hypothetical protein